MRTALFLQYGDFPRQRTPWTETPGAQTTPWTETTPRQRALLRQRPPLGQRPSPPGQRPTPSWKETPRRRTPPPVVRPRPLPVDRQTPVPTLSSQTLFAGGKIQVCVSLYVCVYRLEMVNSKSFVSKILLWIKWKFELTVHFKHEMLAKW